MRVIHRFYILPKRDQKRKFWSFIFNLLIIVTVIVFMAWSTKFWVLLILIQPVISIFASFIDVPTGRQKGQIIYFSPLLLSSAVRKNKIQLHGGTLFDYYYTLSIHKSEKRNKKAILYSYTEGMLNMLDNFVQHHDDITIEANAYFINPPTAENLGFKQVKTKNFQKLIMLLNYFPITISYSIAMGKLSFPNIFSLQSYECRMGELRNNKDKLVAMIERFNQ
jgi:ABC-type multidrug transport system fused ATPase/permease subunit